MSVTFEQFLPISLLFLASLALIGLMLGLPAIIGKRRTHGTIKDTPYECGMPPLSHSKLRFSVKFYLVAMLFILFDIEVVFMVGWAVMYRDLVRPVSQGGIGPVMFWAALLFVAILEIGHFYIWRRGALNWAPLRRKVAP